MRPLIALLVAPAFAACVTVPRDMPVGYQNEPVVEVAPSAEVADEVEPELELEPASFDYLDDRKDRPRRMLSLSAGMRDFTDDTIFGRVDDEIALGIEYAHEISDGWGFEVGTLGSISTESGIAGNVDVTAAAVEFYGGGRYFHEIEDSNWTPYVGAGLSGIYAGVDDDSGGQVADDQDFSFGLYVRGGVSYDLSELLSIGIDLRCLFNSDLALRTVSGDADYVQALGFLAFRL